MKEQIEENAKTEGHHIKAEKPHDNSKSGPHTEQQKQRYWIAGLVVVGLVLVVLLFTNGTFNTSSSQKLDSMATPEIGSSNEFAPEQTVIIEEYIDFQCPYCKKAAPTIKQLKELYGDKIRVVYKHFPLGFHQYAQKAAEASECARDQDMFLEYHDLLFENQQALNVDNLKKYAADLGLNTEKFNTCLDSGEKAQVVKDQMAEGQQQGVSGTPAFIINGKLIAGALPIESFVPVIDKALGGDSGVVDKLYADEPEIEFIVINDQTCTSGCDTSQIVQVTRQFFPRLNLKEVDVNSEEGKQFVQTYNLEKVPSYLFSTNVIEAGQFKEDPRIANAFDKLSDRYKLKDAATGATRFIDQQKQAAQEAQLTEQKQMMLEKLDIGDKPQIDFFVMSYCPYGNQAEEAIEKVYQVLGDKAVFRPHFVIYENYRGGGPNYCLDSDNKYCSMHGIQELNQDIRELCVYEDYGTKKFFEFALAMNRDCSAANADTCWTAVAEKIGLDTGRISTCETKRGMEFAKEDRELNNLLGVRGSPTIFINGKPFNGPRSSEGYQSALCAVFEEQPSECGSVIEEAAQAPATGGCG